MNIIAQLQDILTTAESLKDKMRNHAAQLSDAEGMPEQPVSTPGAGATTIPFFLERIRAVLIFCEDALSSHLADTTAGQKEQLIKVYQKEGATVAAQRELQEMLSRVTYKLTSEASEIEAHDLEEDDDINLDAMSLDDVIVAVRNKSQEARYITIESEDSLADLTSAVAESVGVIKKDAKAKKMAEPDDEEQDEEEDNPDF